MNINNSLLLYNFNTSIGHTNKIFNHAEQAYKFKFFRKNIKFKRFNRGLTRFIINRRKYILRKKRTIFIFQTYYVGFWSKRYQISKQFCRFYQMQNILSLSLIFSDVSFFNKLSQQSLTQPRPTSFNSSAISKKLIKKSVFFSYYTQSFLDLTSNGVYGLCFLNNDCEFYQNHFRYFNAGLINIKNSFFYPTTSFNKNTSSENLVLHELKLFTQANFLTHKIFSILKTVRHILLTTVLMSLFLK